MKIGMTHHTLALVLGSVLVLGAILDAQQTPARGAAGRSTTPPAAPAAPPPGSPGSYKSDIDLSTALTSAIAAARGEMATSAVANTDQYRINIVHREKPAGAIAHPGNTEVHYIIDGAGTVVTGGTIVRPAGGNAGSATIQNGETRHMKKGDIIIVPPNTPHWYKDIDGSITYLEVRFVAPTK
jgi:mannose-6-phosphate isomerase-like protein (cupin superfamily)